MTDYTPSHVGSVTKYVVVESFGITPADLAIRGYEISQGVMIKETCFGLVVSGKEAEVDRIVAGLRAIDPDHIFVKDRGFPPGDARRCRANLGGARPGYNGMEFEMTILPLVSHGLEEINKHDAATIPSPTNPLEHVSLDITLLKKLVEAQES
ncbi:methanogenesis marker 6 protein [uncultured Methanoregula sp.]|uniref:methanogenesis marker 6 protein n=1 Tax=uncultured Methanoregula sp. TaxID=1005933 RepID=UPI002AAAC6B5|nr:methanogenesis marker 6 protein [uncultured Methanoregula sp.]